VVAQEVLMGSIAVNVSSRLGQQLYVLDIIHQIRVLRTDDASATHTRQGNDVCVVGLDGLPLHEGGFLLVDGVTILPVHPTRPVVPYKEMHRLRTPFDLLPILRSSDYQSTLTAEQPIEQWRVSRIAGR
jgi:hypothetical protein